MKSDVPLPYESWMPAGRCAEVDPEIFFPGRETTRCVAAPKAICAGCEVVRECFTYAIRYRIDYGVWGSYSAPERRKLLREGAERRRAREVAEVPPELDEAA
jgi:WhiB family redox-sensing transcriptional regulator